jgi:hypothetical protein
MSTIPVVHAFHPTDPSTRMLERASRLRAVPWIAPSR